jgi:hypothetical protein
MIEELGGLSPISGKSTSLEYSPRPGQFVNTSG